MDLLERFEQAGQGHVFKFFDKLDKSGQSELVKQLEQVDLPLLGRLNNELVFRAPGETPSRDFSKLKPAPYRVLPADKDSVPAWVEAKDIGEKALTDGRVAVFLVAGGQGTRLGFNAPKGCYKITPVKRKSLFQVFAEKILSASRKYGARIPWLIMTSPINDADTKRFFSENSFFGLDKNDVIFFSQGLMPAVDRNGKIILESKGRIAMTPDGHGGSLRAMCASGAVDELKRRGIDCIGYFQVDNPLVDIVDPYFFGFHIMGKSEMSSKMIPKAYPLEKVGHFCVSDGKLSVVEYSDMPVQYQQKLDENGKLEFIAGSVAIHILDRNFVERLGCKNSELHLPFHRSDKKIPYADENGDTVAPDAPNGIKFEMFVFDALPMAKSPVIIEGFRGDEFSPVKNAEGMDSPETCRNDQKKQFARWFKSAGINVPLDTGGTPLWDIEVSPLFASNERDFVERWTKLDPKPEVCNNLYLS